MAAGKTREQLEQQLAQLRRELKRVCADLENAEETLRAIHHGEVDALVIDTPEGQRIFTLEGADQPYRILIEKIQEGTASLSLEGVIRYANQRLANMLGMPLERLTGSPLEEHLVEADRPALRRLLAAVEQETARCEARLYAEDGREVPVLLSFSRIEEAAPCIGVIVTDLTVQKQAEQRLARTNEELEQRVAERTQTLMSALAERERTAHALRQSEERLRLAVGAGRMGTWDWDLASNRVQWSEEHYRLFGLEPSSFEPTYQDVCRYVHPEDLERLEGVLHEALGQQQEYTCEFRIVRGDGAIRWMEARGQFVRDAEAKPVRGYGVVMDVSLRKQVEQERMVMLDAERAARGEIERINRVKDEFLATLSHELRSPLSAILGWTRILKKGRAQDVPHALNVIERGGHALTQLIDDMLDMGRIISGKLRLEFQNVEPQALVRDVVDSLRPSVEAKGLILHEDYRNDLGLLRGDPARLRQAVSNLLTNAIKFTPTGGSIHVRLRRSGDRLKLLICDTGQGIDLKFLPHIFGKFLQADASTTRAHGGLGLGLAIVKHLVEAHCGTVRAFSRGTNRGAAFRLTLPALEAGAELGFGRFKPSPFAAEGIDDKKLLENLRVLVIDDDDDALGLIGRIFAEAGAEVASASSVAEAMTSMQARPPTVVISDLSMPGEDGYDLVRKIRAQGAACGRMICVALTALARPEDRERALAVGFDAHLSKTCQPTTILQTVQTLLARSMRERSDEAAHVGDAAARPKHVLVAEDYETISEMIRVALEEAGYRVTVVASVREGMEVAATDAPDLLLSDLRLKDRTGWQ